MNLPRKRVAVANPTTTSPVATVSAIALETSLGAPARRSIHPIGIAPNERADGMASLVDVIERTDLSLKQVASHAGFGNVDVMRRAFVRLLGITPRRYRELAGSSGQPPR